MLTGEPRQVEREIFKKTFYVSLIPLISSLISGEFSSFLGILVGLIISFLLFRLKAINIERALNMSAAGASAFLRNRYFVNYIIYFIILLLAYKNPRLNFISTVMGLLLLKFTIIGVAIFEIIHEKWKNKLNSFAERGNIDESRT